MRTRHPGNLFPGLETPPPARRSRNRQRPTKMFRRIPQWHASSATWASLQERNLFVQQLFSKCLVCNSVNRWTHQLDSRNGSRAAWHCASQNGAPQLSRITLRDLELLLVQVVVLVILRALQRQLESEAVLGDLVNPYARVHLDRSRVCAPLAACLGCGIGLRRALPAGVEKLVQRFFVLEGKDDPIALHDDAQTATG